MKYKLAKGWTKSRAKELDDLCRLISVVESLNSGNNHLERTQLCIEMARKLDRHSWKRRRQSFLAFLRGLALVEVPEDTEPCEECGLVPCRCHQNDYEPEEVE